jgi:probable HAF family extracellular repeat protein
MVNLCQKTVQQFIAAVALGLFLCVMTAGNGVVLASSAVSLGHSRSTSHKNVTYQFTTLNDNADPTFNQLLGINNHGVIAGYFGSGTVVNGTLHPNKGYTLSQPYGQGNYTNENFPGSVQTQVTAINNIGDTAGFWVDGAGNNFGFIRWNGGFTSYKDPNTASFNGVQVNQLLGINDKGIAVGFYTDGNGNNHAYKLDQNKNKFIEIPTATIPGAVSVMATGINNNGDIVGTYTDANGTMHGFLLKGKNVSVFDYTGVANVTNTTFLGVNDSDQIVGTYTVGTGNSAQMHGFLLSNPLHHAQWQTIDDPNGIGTTTINGLNDNADLVGFYVDGNGNTDGFLARKS